jgi:mannose-6-phosphate isomerase-like protein (cupin superfamily)
MKTRTWKAADILAKIPAIESGKDRYIEPFVRGTTSLGMYAPIKEDLQQAHTQDELYFVISGSGIFVHDGERTAFEPGDALFVAAGTKHRFEQFTEDFATWVVFWSPTDER